MVALFKDRSPSTIIWLLLLSIAVRSHFFIEYPQVITPRSNGFISLVLNDIVAGWHPLLLMLLYHGLVVGQALRLNFLFNDHRMFSKVNFLTAAGYVLLTGIIAEWNNISPALVANTLVIWLFSKLIRLYNNNNPKTLLFNIGLIVGLCIMLYHPATILILIAMFALLVIRPFYLSEWLVMLMGILAPFYFLWSFLYLTNRFQSFRYLVPSFGFNMPTVNYPVMFFVSIGMILLILVIGILHWQSTNRRMIVQVRKNWGVLLVMLLIMLPLPFISKNASVDSVLLWAVPVSPFAAQAFLSTKKNLFPNILFWLLVALVIINSYQLIKY